jgi:hypothetical protein
VAMLTSAKSPASARTRTSSTIVGVDARPMSIASWSSRSSASALDRREASTSADAAYPGEPVTRSTRPGIGRSGSSGGSKRVPSSGSSSITQADFHHDVRFARV